jgi:linoleoyl-CoA desaturase
MPKSQQAKLSFSNGGDFIRDTRREVELHLERPGVRRRARRRLYAKTVVAFALLLASWSTLVAVHPSGWGIVACFAGLVLGTIVVAFCIQHDANHGAYFRTRRANHLMGWTSDALLGFSSYAWRVKHNVAHHTYTNVEGYDDDVDQLPFLRLMPSQERRPWYRLQHVYIWPLYSLMVLRWQTGADVAAIVRGRVGQSALHVPRRWDLAGLVAGKAVFVGWALAVPMLVYPWWGVLAVYVAVTMVTSLVSAVTFQLAHAVEEADFTTPSALAASPRVWAVHEVETTVDFCQRNPVLTWILGGLNFQIEHHLFPRVPHTHYAEIAGIVRRNAQLHGVRYTAQPTLRAAVGSHFRHLRAMGRVGMPVAIEMG